MSGIGPELLARLLDERGPALELYARQWCDSPVDVVQEALVQLVRQPTVPPQLIAWLYRTVRNGAISARRAADRRQRHERAAASAGACWFAADPAGGLDPQVAGEALADLPLEEREVIVAHLWGGLKFEEIADVVGTSSSTAHRRYQAGLAALLTEIGGSMFSERSERDEIDPESAALAAALAGLVPQQSTDRDRLMFLAGQASVTQRGPAGPFRRVVWRSATAAAVLAASLASFFLGRELHAPALPQVATQVPRGRVPQTQGQALEPGDSIVVGSGAVAASPVAKSDRMVRQFNADRSSPNTDYLDLRRRVLSFGIDSLSWPDGAGRFDAQPGQSFLEIRGELLHRDTPPRRALDLDPPYSAGART